MVATIGFFILIMFSNSTLPMVIGHRGACGSAPENTLVSFEKAIDCGVPMVEFDVRVCKSGELVVIHDETVDRTTNGTGRVAELTLDQLKQLDAGEGQKIVSLSELLDFIDRRVWMDIELKGPDTAEPTVQVVQKYVHHKGWQYDDFIITSKDHHELCKAKKLCPDVPIGAILDSMLIDCGDYLKKIPLSAIIIEKEMVREWFMRQLLEADLPIWVYTINDPDEMQELYSKNIAAIFSDYPDKILKRKTRPKPGF